MTTTAAFRSPRRSSRATAEARFLDESGAVVGIVVAKLNALKVAEAYDDVPQNINFAIKASVAARFLEDAGVPYLAAGPGTPLRPADLAALAQSFTVAIRCPP